MYRSAGSSRHPQMATILRDRAAQLRNGRLSVRVHAFTRGPESTVVGSDCGDSQIEEWRGVFDLWHTLTTSLLWNSGLSALPLSDPCSKELAEEAAGGRTAARAQDAPAYA